MVNTIFLDIIIIMPHKLFAVEIYLVTKRFCRAQIKSTGFKPKKLQTNKRITRHYRICHILYDYFWWCLTCIFTRDHSTL